ATTGPLGQGIAMAVGMAMAEAQLGATYNRDGYSVVDHHTFVICGDGDMMEGVASEAASLAGHLKLGKLVVLYDSNDITLDGESGLSFSENVRQRYEAYGWNTLLVEDGNDLAAIAQAVEKSKQDSSKPTLIEVKTVIGYGSPNKQGKGGHGGTHGSPLGADEAKLTKEFYKWGHEDFFVPEEVYNHFDTNVKQKGIQANEEWNKMFQAYQAAYPELAKQFETAISGQLPEGWDKDLPAYAAGDKALSTRVASGNALNGLAKNVPNLTGGSADLESSTMTHLNDLTAF
ncbi:transketolase, partial [Enterobacter quasiroggenkampii]|nr:transketolase [Enterobacter quasiroggenkampii]